MSPWAVACLLGALKFYVYASPVSSSISGLAPTTASNPSISLTTLGTALPTCIQPRASTDPPASQISSSLASASVVEKSCNSTTGSVARVGAIQIVYYNSGAYYLNITRLASLHLPVVPASYCPQQFRNIIETCVVQQSFWGGWITSYGVNWSVSNFDYPQNPLPLPSSSSGASGSTASTKPPQQGTPPLGSPVSTGTGTTSASNSEAESAGSETELTSGGVAVAPSGPILTTTQGSSTVSTTVAIGSTSTAVASNSVTLHTNGTLLPGVFPAKNTVSTTLSQVGMSQSAATTTPAAPSGVLIGAGGITQLTGPTTITPDYSITNAFPSGVSTTTLSASNGAVLVYSMQTFADLTTLTGGPILVQTSVTETESDGHHTVFIGGVWVGPGGRYWGPPGLPKVEAPGINLPKISPPCIWPFCSGRVTDDGGGGGDPGGNPPSANDPDPDDPKNQSEQNESQRNTETEEKTSMASTGTSATTSQSSLSSSVSTTTSISSSTPSSMSTSTISSSSLSSNMSSSMSSTSSSSSYSINGTVTLPDQGYVYTTMELSDAMSWSAAVQSCLIGLVIPTAPLWAPTDSAESAEQAHATDSFSFYIALPPGSLTAEPSGTSQAVDESTSATQRNTPGTVLSLLPSTPTLATPTTSSVAVARSSPASTTAAAPPPSPPRSPSPSPSPPPPPTPSLAIIIWRQDDCSDIVCESEARVFDIAAGAQSSVNPCTDGKVDYSYQFAADVANDNSDYTIAFGKFTTHNIKDVSYAGSNLHAGKLTGTGLPGGSVQCEIPQPVATSCSSSHSLDADDQTPIAYCAW
ncbi:hypothetical protein JMJ35_001515 [Cladonia borealis]|uniref:Uncharacterized protein n=1 Tax=Cladonia borealis TaxID=184061 RepID=A0AA39R8M1_9LECA|nr:hypothetical protein JMJ35_001515 [Cladonia borealis]